MSYFKGLIFSAVAALGVAVSGGASNASTLKFYNDVNPTLDTLRATITCTLGCQAAIFDTDDSAVAALTGWSSTTGDLVDNLSGAKKSTDFVNRITNSFFDKDADRTETARGGLSNTSFLSSAQYILFKIGTAPNVGLIWNTGGFGNLFTFTQAPGGTGAGLSNTEEFGRYDPPGGVIPVPAGLPLLLSALGLGGLLARRRQKSA